MKTVNKANGCTVTRMSREELGIVSPAAMCLKDKAKEEEKDVYMYGMTKDEYEKYLDNLYS